MSDIQTSTVSDDGFASTSQVGEFELTIDATGEETPDTNPLLAAAYASYYLPPLRVGAQHRLHHHLATLQVDATTDHYYDDHLDAIPLHTPVTGHLGP